MNQFLSKSLSILFFFTTALVADTHVEFTFLGIQSSADLFMNE